MIGWALRACVGAMFVGALASVVRYDEVWTPVQRLDFLSYVRASVTSTVGFSTSGSYALMCVVDRHGRQLVTDDTAWQVPIGGAPSWILSAGAKAAGAQRLEWTTTTYAHAALAAFFKDAVYAGQSPFALFAPSLRSTVLTFAALLFLACVNDLMRHTGRRIRGSELVTPRLFNRRVRADGLTILQQPGRFERLFHWQPRVRLSRRLEAHHTLVWATSAPGPQRSSGRSSGRSPRAVSARSFTTPHSSSCPSATRNPAATSFSIRSTSAARTGRRPTKSSSRPTR